MTVAGQAGEDLGGGGVEDGKWGCQKKRKGVDPAVIVMGGC